MAGLPAELESEQARQELERRLRDEFPAAVVRARDPLAAIQAVDDALVVWYASNRGFGTRLAATLVVPVPIERAFTIYVERVAEWLTSVRMKAVHIAPRVVGSVYLTSYEMAGMTIHGRFRIVEADAPYSVRFEAEGCGVFVWYITSFRPTERGTRIQVVGDYDLPNTILARVASRFGIERTIQRQMNEAHAALLRLCEEVARPAEVVTTEPALTADPVTQGHPVPLAD